MGTRTLVAEALGNIDRSELSQRSPCWHQDLAPPNNLQDPVLESLRPNNSKTITQPYSSVRVLKVFLSSQPSQNTPLDTGIPTRRKSKFHPPEGRYQSLPLGSLRKPQDQPQPSEDIHPKQEELWSCSLLKGDHKHRNLDKMRQPRNMLKMKEQHKNLQEQLNEEEIGNLPEK